ncbi:P-loop NTPase fold protein [Aggregatibacter sp. HMT-949]|uniref:KAP family P-loop NTPase fold protein n=1 Tax=Aggregatibacter sp. HMT-949 TaxID=3235088 RepID=UPI00359C7DCE
MELISDNPIKDISADLLDRKNSAEKFAKYIFSFNYKDGLVIGICGEWGSGKTSYINLMKPELQKNSIVIDFNPWMFSDSYNLVSLFFTEMAAQIKDYNNNTNLIKALDNLGDFFSSLRAIPLVGEYIGILGKLLNIFAKKKKGENSLQKQRSNLIKELKKIEKPIVVILDDIDRLSSDELESILKLVRLTGRFPNIIYLLSFDKERVVNTLNNKNIDGESYLEKIIQIPFDIPKVSRELLEKHLFASLDSILGNVEIDRYRWSEAYLNIIKPTIKNIRDVKRYISSLSYTFNQVGKFINVVDLVTIEIIKVFYPKSFKELFLLREYLTSIHNDDSKKIALTEFIKDNQINKILLYILFDIDIDITSNFDRTFINNDKNFRRDKRIADLTLFNFYFEQVENEEFKNIILSQTLWSYMSSDKFAVELAKIDENYLESVVNNLANYEADFTEKTAMYSIPALYEILPRVPEKERGFFEFDAHIIWSRLVYRLLRKISDNLRYNSVLKLIDLCNIYGQYEIMGIVGHREKRGHKLVSEEQARNIEDILISHVNSSSLDTLSKTYKLSNIFYFIVSTGNSINKKILRSNEIFLSLLKSSVSEIKRQVGSNPEIIREKILHWDALVKIYDNEEHLKNKISLLEKDHNLIEEDYIKLAIKYKNGWRHNV